MVLLPRKVASIYIPSVQVVEDKDLFDSMFEAHCQQKLLFNDLIKGGVNHEEILEALELYIGTSQMDSYIASSEQQLDELEKRVLWLSD